MKTLSDASAPALKGEILQEKVERKLDVSQDDYLKVIKGKHQPFFSCLSGRSRTH